MKVIKIGPVLFFFMLLPLKIFGQLNPYWQEPTAAESDSLKILLQSTDNDSLKMYLNQQLGLYYTERSRSIAIEYYKVQLDLAKRLNQKLWEAEALSKLGYLSSIIQNYPGSLNYLLAARDLASDPNSEIKLWGVHLLTDDGDTKSARLTVLLDIFNHLGVLNFFVGNYDRAIGYFQEATELNKIRQDEVITSLLHMNKGESYFAMKKNDLAKTELEKALKHAKTSGYTIYVGLIYWDIGRIYESEGNYSEAEKYYELSVATNLEQDRPDFLGMGYLALAELYKTKGSLDLSYLLANKALSTHRAMSDSLGMINAHSSLASLFDARSQIDSAYYHMKEGAALNSAMNKEERVKEFQVFGLNEQLKLNKLETEQILYQSRIQMYGLAAGIGILFLISMITYRNNIRQKKDKAIIEKSYETLKSTQAQLVQQEKLASLGQLTAGIAHEIKNPLNFVNNFSEVSMEMIEEVLEARSEKRESRNKNQESRTKNQEKDEELEEEILEDIKANLKKIHEHGSRANGIVTSMLQHSRGGSGKMEPTDLNALIKEYVNLSFHGMRAGKNPIDVEIELDLDKAIKEIPLVREDFTRVIINLCNNAFDACAERSRSTMRMKADLTGFENLSGLEPYHPKLTVRTKTENDHILISVEDNGPGISDEIKDKILQPFFTTKKGTEGTGLGLSITHDIVKAHGGQLSVESILGNDPNSGMTGAKFIISLPLA